MKFLCVPCDEPMKLEETKADDKGSISLRYSCGECGYEMAMLTNPFETQLVSSMGVKMGPDQAAAAGQAAAGGQTAASGSGAAAAPAGKCPFTGMVQAMGVQEEAAPAAGSTGTPAAQAGDGFAWSSEARERLSQLPDFVRPMAKTGIEKWAQDKGYARVDAEVLDEAKDFFGM